MIMQHYNYVDIDGEYLHKCLQQYREKGGISQERLARKLGRSKSYIGNLIRSGRADGDELKTLCRIIGADYELATNKKIMFYPSESSVLNLIKDNKPKPYVKPSTRETAKSLILHILKSGEKGVSEVDEFVKAHGISEDTLRYAKTDLKNEGKIQYRTTSDGKGKGTAWYISLSRLSAPSYKNDVRQMLDKISEKQAEIVTAQLEINTLLCKCWEEIKNV